MFQIKQKFIPLYAPLKYAAVIFLPSFAQASNYVITDLSGGMDTGFSLFFLTLFASFAFGFFSNREKHRDSSESKELEKCRSIIHNMNDAVYLFKVHSDGKPGNFEDVNQVTVNRMGYSVEELHEMTVTDIAADDLKRFTQSRVKQIFDEEHITFEWAHKSKDSRIIPVEISAQLMYFGDEPYILGVARDISQRKKNELMLEHLNRIHRAIRNVNRTIVDETNIRPLLDQTCKELTRDDAYTSAWIALLDENHNLLEFTESGLGSTRQAIEDHLVRGTLPDCIMQVTDSHEPTVMERSTSNCNKCVLKSIEPHGQVIAGPIEYRGNLFGIL
ncbi:MAG: PAS domain S-box protein, partial [Candidatus Marinimicrobia bacterium]|nr:PAS domain S-box protein [Candidatus Neomarinimicrobiota bacterium]